MATIFTHVQCVKTILEEIEAQESDGDEPELEGDLREWIATLAKAYLALAECLDRPTTKQTSLLDKPAREEGPVTTIFKKE